MDGSVVESVALILSAFGSAWLLWVCSPRSRHLSSRQLWHLGAANLLHTTVQLASEVRAVSRGGLPSQTEAIGERAVIHFCLLAVCLVETLIAAGVTLSGIRDVGVARWLAKLTPCLWVVAAICEGVDAVSLKQTTEILPSGAVTGSCMVLGIVMGTCFLMSTVLYSVAIALLVRSSAPGVVTKRRSSQALIYLLVFFITTFPTWWIYINYSEADKASKSQKYEWADVLFSALFASNGWLNAATRICQDRRLRFRRDSDIGEVDSASLCVGFGHVSTLSAPSLA